MASGSQRKVTLNCVDCCATITNKLMYVPEIAWCLQILDERSALNGITNPFDNHSRLQAIIGKCRANNQVQLTWVMQGIWYHWRRRNIASLSINDIKGAPSTGNRGLANHLLCKHELKPAMMVNTTTTFRIQSLGGPTLWAVLQTRTNLGSMQRSRMTSHGAHAVTCMKANG